GYLAGISRMPFKRYMLASAIGMAPGMFAYTVLGYDLTQANQATWRIGLMLAGLALLYLLGRWLMQRRGSGGGRETMPEER
ncbi:MAG: hypothetical protein MUD01_19560, partial [Chloroflexaceae bacterium]|nr:hypothetical protein [Chloroflexaceae bacterium]